ncbi:MAG: PSD1 and planctomycete cytochrome C domain-containing protein, partial [Gemmataceae bacterium]|nr:PSD1 and planctomycete cytochrome C domain-containing protein [Gemmataceae bacterium]
MRWLRQRLLVLAGFLSLSLLALSAAAREKPPAAAPIFEKDILPILEAKCLRCHGADQQKADLDLRSKTTVLKGGETGPAISPGSAERSALWVKVAADKMPPGQNKLTEAEKELVRTWLETGARDNGTAVVAETHGDRQVTESDRQFWAFQKPVRPDVPQVQHTSRVRNPIDAFVLAALEKKGLTLAPEADRLVLLRRASLDLIGLPPSPRAIEAFLADSAEGAYDRLIDRLLASQHYGERWGRHWLDIAGYADSEGILDADYVRTASWRYRDYVIRSFNQDKPYDRFLKEQLAGDELVDYWTAYRTQRELSPDVLEGLIATGYLRCASDTSRPDFVNIKNAPGYYYQTLNDTVKIVASSLLGLTVQCAKCHSHKYDPILQTDYYRLQAIFMSGYRPSQWVPQVERRRLEASEAQEKEANAYNAHIDADLAPFRKQLTELQQQYGERLFQERLAQLPEVIREDVRLALNTEAAKRTEVQKYLAGKFQKDLRPEPGVLAKTLEAKYPEYKTKRQPLEAAIRAGEAKRHTFPEIRAFYDLPGEAKTHLLRRGDYLNPGPEVQPGVLAVVSAARPFTWTPPAKEIPTSGRRRAFAEWLTQPDHPLTARVLVNRLWSHHFGAGIGAEHRTHRRQDSRVGPV